MGKPIDKKDTDQRTVTEYLRDTNPVAYAAMMQRETVQPSTFLSMIKKESAPTAGRRYIEPFDKPSLVKKDDALFFCGVRITADPTLKPSYLGSPTTLQNFDAYIKARLREMYPETDGVPPPPLEPHPLLSMIKKEPAPAAGRRYIEPYEIGSLKWKLPPGAEVAKVRMGSEQMTMVADPSLPKNACFMIGVDLGVEPSTAAAVVMKVEQCADGPHYTVVDEWREAIDHESRKIDNVQFDGVCGVPGCFCAMER